MSNEDRLAIEWKAQQLGYPSAQHWIRECIRPVVEEVKVEMRVDDDRAAQDISASEPVSVRVDVQ